MALKLKRKWTIGCVGGLGVLVAIAGSLAILDRALSKGLAPIGAELPFEVVEVNLDGLAGPANPSEAIELNDGAQAPETQIAIKKGDRFDLTVQRHATTANQPLFQETSSLGYVVARINECLIAFPAPSQNTQVRGYRTTTTAAHFAAWYYDLRGGLLLLGHGDNAAQASKKDGTLSSTEATRNESLQAPQISDPSLIYLLLDSRWCTWLKVHEGMAIAWMSVE